VAVNADDEFSVLADGVRPVAPASSTAVRWNSPNAPEMMSSALKRVQPTRPMRKARKYSIT
jgi:hypothetical protein